MKKTIIFNIMLMTAGLQHAAQEARRSIDLSHLDSRLLTPSTTESVTSPGISSSGNSPDQMFQGSYSFPLVLSSTPTIGHEALSLREQWNQEEAFIALVALINLPEKEETERTKIEEHQQRANMRLPQNFDEYLRKILTEKIRAQNTNRPDCNDHFPNTGNIRLLFPDLRK